LRAGRFRSRAVDMEIDDLQPALFELHRSVAHVPPTMESSCPVSDLRLTSGSRPTDSRGRERGRVLILAQVPDPVHDCRKA
jgi:hypothetical protein